MIRSYHSTVLRLAADASSASSSQTSKVGKDNRGHGFNSAPPLPDSTSGPSAPSSPYALSHIDAKTGQARMVDVSQKPFTFRSATAKGRVIFSSQEAFDMVVANYRGDNNLKTRNKKGDIFTVAQIAGIQAAKQTANLVPLCHPIAGTISDISVEFTIPGLKDGEDDQGKCGLAASSDSLPSSNGANTSTFSASESVKPVTNQLWAIEVTACVSCTAPTGVEMEAIVAASIASVTIVDMCKAVDKRIRITDVRVVEKIGGKSGVFRE
ncbi:hypothetical protein HK102_007688 [Quaeritorhiza haematococci]|nr:hypothetical protein HK102_007688 [Quaeritorhiza haematococci]